MMKMVEISPSRAGRLPVTRVIDACYSGKYTHKEMKKKVGEKAIIFL
ncbi:MAG: hypothetical protein ACLTK8_00815 [Paeniclostridium sp.]